MGGLDQISIRRSPATADLKLYLVYLISASMSMLLQPRQLQGAIVLAFLDVVPDELVFHP